MKEFDDLVDIISRLRKECPWDREQTHESLAKHLIEEAYELLDALAAMQTNPENHDMLNEELGDLLLQILLHSKIAEENKYFSIVDVVSNLQEKLIKRHPHVFGDVELESAEDVEKQWEEIKKQESSESIFDDIEQKLPSITKAFKTQRKAKKLDCISPRMLPDPRNCKSFIAREYPVDVCPMDFIASSLNSASTPKFVL